MKKKEKKKRKQFKFLDSVTNYTLDTFVTFQEKKITLGLFSNSFTWNWVSKAFKMSYIDTVNPDTRNKSISDPGIKTWRIIYLSKISNILTGALFNGSMSLMFQMK